MTIKKSYVLATVIAAVLGLWIISGQINLGSEEAAREEAIETAGRQRQSRVHVRACFLDLPGRHQ